MLPDSQYIRRSGADQRARSAISYLGRRKIGDLRDSNRPIRLLPGARKIPRPPLIDRMYKFRAYRGDICHVSTSRNMLHGEIDSARFHQVGFRPSGVRPEGRRPIGSQRRLLARFTTVRIRFHPISPISRSLFRNLRRLISVL